MSNALFDAGREAFLDGTISWTGDDIKCHLIDSADDTIDLAADEFLADRAAGSIVATSGNLASKTVSAGIADADDVILSSVSGDVSEAIELYKDTGSGATSTLIAHIDTADGLPITPNGTNITITWNNGTNRIFKL